MCVSCYHEVGHQHPMDHLGLMDLDADDSKEGRPGSVPAQPGGLGANSQDDQRRSIQRCIQSLVHACQCQDSACAMPSCSKMKRVVQHIKTCKRKANNTCPICKQLLLLCCYHSKHCTTQACPVPLCTNIKQKRQQQQMQKRQQQQMMLRRRMQATRMLADNQAVPSAATSAGSTAASHVVPNPHSSLIGSPSMNRPAHVGSPSMVSSQSDLSADNKLSARMLAAQGALPGSLAGQMGMNQFGSGQLPSPTPQLGGQPRGPDQLPGASGQMSSSLSMAANHKMAMQAAANGQLMSPTPGQSATTLAAASSGLGITDAQRMSAQMGECD